MKRLEYDRCVAYAILGYDVVDENEEDDLDDYFDEITKDVKNNDRLVYYNTDFESDDGARYYIGVLIKTVQGHYDAGGELDLDHLDEYKQILKPVSDLEVFKDRKPSVYMIVTSKKLKIAP